MFLRVNFIFPLNLNLGFQKDKFQFFFGIDFRFPFGLILGKILN